MSEKRFICYEEAPERGSRGTLETASDAEKAAVEYLMHTHDRDMVESVDVFVRQYGTSDVFKVSCSVRMVLEVETEGRPLRVQGLFDDGSQVPGETPEERERRVWDAEASGARTEGGHE